MMRLVTFTLGAIIIRVAYDSAGGMVDRASPDMHDAAAVLAIGFFGAWMVAGAILILDSFHRER